jgi:small multidrug resistance pump
VRIHWAWLASAIVAEVIATSALRAAHGFTRLGPSTLAVFGYAIAYVMLSLALRTLPLGIAYACWSAVGIALISLVGWMLYGQHLDVPAVVGLALIVTGVLVICGFSAAVPD